jgi:ubiquinone/menaquinone biosynthesis C-methylase UbiE
VPATPEETSVIGKRFEVSRSAAEAYERNNVSMFFAPWAKVLVEHAPLTPGDRVLDTACGTGIVARTAAPLLGASSARISTR